MLAILKVLRCCNMSFHRFGDYDDDDDSDDEDDEF